MIRQVREGVGQFPQATTLEHLVVSQRAYIHRDIPAESFGNVPAGILAADAQELLVEQGSTFVFDDMQRILEGNLLVGLCPRVLRNGILLRLEIQEIQRVGQLVQEGLDALGIDVVLVLQRTLDLHVLDGAEVVVPQIFESNLAVVVAFQFLAEGESSTTLAAIDIEDRRLGQMSGAILPERTVVRIVTLQAEIGVRLVSGQRFFRCCDHLRNHLILLLDQFA